MSNFLNLFGVPIYNENVDFRLDISTYNNLEYRRVEDNGYITDNHKILDLDIFSDLKNTIQNQIDIYARQVLHIKDDVKFEITSSWINKHLPGDWTQGHDHVNSLISGIYYIDSPQNGGDLVFHKDRSYVNLFPRIMSFEFTHWEPWNCEAWRIIPQTGDIVLFPSTLIHSVTKNKSNKQRFSLAFNVFPRGHLGSHLATGKIDL